MHDKTLLDDLTSTLSAMKNDSKTDQFISKDLITLLIIQDALLMNINGLNMSHLLIIIITLCLQASWIRE